MQTKGHWFVDSSGRRLMLRGVNLSGASKVPTEPDGATHLNERFFDHTDVSFVGRPFPLAEADEHFRRLRHWGLTTLRFLITWEAIEHDGPGIYDRDILIIWRLSFVKRVNTVCGCSSTPTRMSGVAFQAATARLAGRWRLWGST